MSKAPIKAAILSFGMSGRVFQAPFLSVNPNFILHGCWERSTKKIQTLYPATISYHTYEALLADNEVELVIVNTPNVTHFNFAKQALLAGKHVVIEKPFAVTTAECLELIELAKSLNLKLSVFQNRRYDSDYLTVKEVVDQNIIGKVVEAELHFDRFSDKLNIKAHKEVPVKGVGLTYDLGSHLIDQALQLFGMPSAVFADLRTLRPMGQVDDYLEILLYYTDLRVRIKATLYARETQGYIFHGTKGSFFKPKTNIQEEALSIGTLPIGEDWSKEQEKDWGVLHTEIDGLIVRKKIPSVQGNYMRYFEGIYNAIRHGEPPTVLPEESMNVIKIIEAAIESNEKGHICKL